MPFLSLIKTRRCNIEIKQLKQQKAIVEQGEFSEKVDW